jgi:hypothetical protein
MTADEKFFAWLDGELSGAEAAETEAKVASDPELARLAEQHRALRSELKSVFDQVAEAPVPKHLIDAVRPPPAQVIDFQAAKSARELRGSWPPAAQWAAMAATLVLGFFAGTFTPRHNNAPVTVQDGALYASASLNQALSSALASAPNGPVRIGLTYRDQTGSICRTFTEAKSSGLACRDGARWQLRGLFPAPEGQGDAYRMAAGMDPNLATLVNSTIAGDPFDSGEEEKERQRGWK